MTERSIRKRTQVNLTPTRLQRWPLNLPLSPPLSQFRRNCGGPNEVALGKPQIFSSAVFAWFLVTLGRFWFEELDQWGVSRKCLLLRVIGGTVVVSLHPESKNTLATVFSVDRTQTLDACRGKDTVEEVCLEFGRPITIWVQSLDSAQRDYFTVHLELVKNPPK